MSDDKESGVLSQSVLTSNFAVFSEAEGFGAMPTSKLVLEQGKSKRDAVHDAMADVFRQAFAKSGE